jgi:hypothetical protein
LSLDAILVVVAVFVLVVVVVAVSVVVVAVDVIVVGGDNCVGWGMFKPSEFAKPLLHQPGEMILMQRVV